MSQSLSRKRPWLAALLGALVTGLGHVYLRRWRRALGWLAVLFGVSILFVDPAAVDALATGDAVDPIALAPILVVGSLSVVDAYLLAYTQNSAAQAPVARDGHLTDCPNCGKELDSDIDFCHWCTTDLEDFEDASSGQTDERGPRTDRPNRP